MSAPKSKYITGILYPEHFSSYDDMIHQITDLRLAACLSPLHDRDLLESGKPEKPHYHLIISLPTGKTINQAKQIFSHVEGVRVELVYDEGAMTRYLTHFGFNEERKYSYYQDSKLGEPFEDLVFCCGGYQYRQLFYLLPKADDILKTVMKDIEKFHLVGYIELLTFYIARNKTEILTWIGKNKYIVQDICKVKQLVEFEFNKELEKECDDFYAQQQRLKKIVSDFCGDERVQLQHHLLKVL